MTLVERLRAKADKIQSAKVIGMNVYDLATRRDVEALEAATELREAAAEIDRLTALQARVEAQRDALAVYVRRAANCDCVIKCWEDGGASCETLYARNALAAAGLETVPQGRRASRLGGRGKGERVLRMRPCTRRLPLRVVQVGGPSAREGPDRRRTTARSAGPPRSG